MQDSGSAAVKRDVTETPARRARKARDPQESRRALVAAAAEIFNTVGYFGTDTNRIARAAGYTPGTFYTHFPDKRAIFLEVYQQWVDAELANVTAQVQSRGPGRRARVAKTILEHHRRWKTFRASLRALYAVDPHVREVRLAQRRRQVDALIKLSRDIGREPPGKACLYADLLGIEMICDAIADGDIKAVGIRESEMFQVLLEKIGTVHR